ncbi:hypothetical protein N7486_011376 [Penicillium sp. IBT 16267x]|nr:hypothetical protein N7486_011376 [Penicillium sp. IBT 16267x]
MKLFRPRIFCLGAAMLPLAATSPDSAVAAITDTLGSGNFNATELAKAERFNDFRARQAQGSVVCTLAYFHLGQACQGNSCALAPDELHFVCPSLT